MAAEEDRVVVEENLKKSNKKQKSSVIDCFSRIINPNEKVRVKSGSFLIKNFVVNDSDDNNVVEVKHALARLIRGAGATKNVSRIGFYSTLCALLKTVDFDVGEILDFIESELHLRGSNSRSENADIAMGHILVCGAVLRSGHFQQTTTENQHKVLQLLISAGKKKTYLTLIAYTFLVEALNTMPTSDFQKSVIPIITPEITKPLEEVGLDNLYFLIAAAEKFPKVVGKKFLRSTVQKPEIIHNESLKSLVDILLGILPIRELLLHPVYELVAKKIAQTDLVPSFIQEVDKALYARPTLVRLHAAAVLITLITENLTNKTYLPSLLPNTFLVETLSHLKNLNFKNQDDVLITIHRFFESLVTALQPEEVPTETKISVINLLLFDPGSFIIEKLTGTKVLQQITSTLNADGVKQLGEIYKDVLLGHKQQVAGRRWMMADRIYTAQLIVKLLKHPSLKGELQWKIDQLKMLMDLGLLTSTSVSHEIAVKLRETFFRALDLKLPKLEDLCTVLSTLLHHIDSQISKDNFDKVLCTPFTIAEYELWVKGVDAVKKLEEKKKINPVFHTLFLHMSLQLFNDQKLGTDSLNELFECYERLKIEKKLKNEDKQDDIKWIEVVVDLFLNLLSHNSHLLRTIIKTVFPHLCKDLTPTAIHQILSVLDPKNEINPLDDNIDLDGEDGEECEEDSDDKEEIESDDEKNEETVSDKLRQAVRAALGTNGAVTDEEDVDLDEMSENECEQLNFSLGAAFKEFKPSLGKHSKRQSKDDEILTHFRIRVLDLVDIYLDSDVSMIICLEIMLPLLHVLEFCIKDPHQKPLLERVNSCLKKLNNVKKFESMEGVSDEILPELLNSMLQKGLKSTILVQEMDEKISDACIFVINCMQAIGNEEVEKKVVKILSEALDTFFERRDCLTPFVLFKNIFKLSWTGTVNFLPTLVQYIFNEEIRPFRRSQGMELLRLFYSNRRLLTSTSTKMKKVQKTINTETLKIFNNLQSNIKERFINNLLLLLTLIKNSPLENVAMQWDQIAEAVREYRSSVNFSKDTKKSFNKLCQALKISNIVESKPNLIKLNNVNNEEVATKEERKKKKNPEQKLKKEVKLLRSKCNSEGLTGLSFAGIEKVQDMEVADGSSDSGVDAGVEVNGFEKKRRKEGAEKHEKKKKIKTK